MGIIAALEHIDRQTDTFAKDVEDVISALITEMQEKRQFGKNLDGTTHVKRLENMIFKRLGLKVNIKTMQHVACILPYYSNRNHIFLHEFWRGNVNLIDQSKLLRKQEGKTGSVNIHKAYVTGIFSEYEHPLYMNFSVMVQYASLSAAEITGILLHELGHGFNACYYSDRTDRTNQVLLSIGERVNGTRSKDDLEYIYRELEKISPSVQKEEVDRFVNGSRVVASLAWFSLVIGMVRSQMQNDRYNDTAYEELSDSFAGRFGYGRPLATALEKLSAHQVEKNPSAMKLAYLIEFIMIVVTAGVAVAALINPVTFLTGCYIAVFSLFWTYISGEDFQDYTYDKLKDRYIRIRQDVIEQLKDKTLSKATVGEMLETVYVMDDIIKSTQTHRNLLTRISNLVFSNNRSALNSIEAQKLLESLASNDLFVASAELRNQ